MAKKKELSFENTRSLEANGFYSDFHKNGTLYAVLVRSPAANGKIKSITVPELPPDYHFYTEKDIPGKKTIIVNKVEEHIFATDYITYTGEPIGILCGPNEKTLFSLLEAISINFDIESLESELNKVIKHQKRPLIHLSDENLMEESKAVPDISDYVSQINALPSLDSIKEYSAGEKEKNDSSPKILASRIISTGLFNSLPVEDAFQKIIESEEVSVCEQNWSQKLVSPTWKETAGAFCYYTEGKKMHIYAPSRWTHSLMTTISRVLSIPTENIYLHKTVTSGIFSKGLWRTSILATQVALASYLSKKPVKLILTQTEQDSYMSPGVKTDVTYKTCINKNGIIKGLIADIKVDAGKTNPFAQEIVDRMCIAACNYYKIENIYIKATAETSLNPPTSICLKSIDSQIFFAIENQMQKLCEISKIYPEDIRLNNTNAKIAKNFPIQIQTGSALAAMENSIKISDFNRKYASFHMDAIERLQKNSNPFFALPLRGIGIATAFNSSGYNGESSFSYDSSVEVTLISGDKAVIHSINPSPDVQEIWKETAAEILQIKKENITIDSSFSMDSIPSSPEDTFSTISSVNELIKKCCNDIQKKRFHQPLPITSKKRVSSSSKKVWNRETFSGNPFISNSFAATVVEVELDSYSYKEKIKGIWISLDCGEVLDENAVRKTVRLEIQQELAMLVADKTIPCDNITIEFIKSKNKPGQVGELIHNTLPAAFSTALSLALSILLNTLPCTEKQIYEQISQRETLISSKQQEKQSPDKQTSDKQSSEKQSSDSASETQKQGEAEK